MIDTRRAAKAPGQSGKIQFAAAQTATPDNSLFSELKKIRRALADSQNVPAYIVFSDAALQSMASIKPRNEDEMLGVSGVGEVKLKKYGRTFLKAIADFESKNKPAINAGIKSARSVYDDPRVSIIEAKYKTCPMKRETATFENRAIVEKARAQHRRAYEPWGSEEDKELDDIYKEIKDVDTLCSIFKRNPGAISSRLKKHEEGRS
jgi:ribonuclease D